MSRVTQRQLIIELRKRLDDHADSPDKAECLRWKARRLQGLPGARPQVVRKHPDGRTEYVLNVGQCRQLYERLIGGPNV